MIFWSILLMILWCWLNGTWDVANLAIGFALGYGILVLLRQRGVIEKQEKFVLKPLQIFKALGLALYFFWELVVANIILAASLLKPKSKLKPAILAVPLDAKTDLEIVLTATLITLTPGTLSMHISEDRSTIYIHTLHVDDEAKAVAAIKNGFEARVLGVLR